MPEQIQPTVSVHRRVAASPAAVFAVLATPQRHLDIDGSGMLRGTDSGPVAGVGDAFVMRMYFEPLGHYEMVNHVVEFERDRRIAWEPESGAGLPEAGTADARWGHRWGFELTPDGADGTVVKETWDCSGVPPEEAEDGRTWLPSMEGTLERLEELVTGVADTPGPRDTPVAEPDRPARPAQCQVVAPERQEG